MPDSDQLRSRGLKATQPRLQILEIFQQTQTRHLTAEEVYQRLFAQGAEVGLATVYRVLTQLHQAGLLKQAHLESDKAVYELDDGTHHDHLVCLTCGHVHEFNDKMIEQRQRKIAQEHDMEVIEHSHIIYGQCTKSQCKYSLVKHKT